MSVVVIYEGHRKTVKLTGPSMIIQDIIADAASNFNLDANKVGLKYRKNLIPRGQLFRFSNIPLNAVIDLVVENTKSQNAVAKIAFSLPSGKSIIKTVSSNSTLGETLQLLYNENIIESTIPIHSIEIIYMRNSYNYDTFQITTLDSLGLQGGSGRFLLKFNPIVDSSSHITAIPEDSIHQNIVDANSNANIDNSSSNDDILKSVANDSDTSMDIVESTMNSHDNNISTSTTISTAISDNTHLHHHHAVDTNMTNIKTMEGDEYTNKNDKKSIFESNQSTIVKDISMDIPSSDSCSNHVDVALPSSKELLNLILSSNFDKASKPAILTISKYIQNIIIYPTESKYKSINLSNKVFQEKVVPVKYTLEYLASIGFISSPTHPPGKYIVYPEDISIEVLIQQRITLDQAMNTLEIDINERPWNDLNVKNTISNNESNVNNSKEQVNGNITPSIAFDPCKPLIYRAAQQPVRETISITERKLEQLKKKQQELIGQPEDIERLTEVILPYSSRATQSIKGDMGISIHDLQSISTSSSTATTTTTIENITTTTTNTTNTNATTEIKKNEDEEEEEENNIAISVQDTKLLGKTIMNMMKKAQQIEDIPLMTKDMKLLQQLEKKKIYKRILIRVRFPDGLCLQGYFHPYHTAHTIYTWILQSLSTSCQQAIQSALSPNTPSNASSSSSSSSSLLIHDNRSKHKKLKTTYRPFELYTTPPKKVISDDDTVTLDSLQFAPATMMNLSWIDFQPLEYFHPQTTTTTTTTTASMSGRADLSSDIKLLSDNIDDDNNNKSKMNSYQYISEEILSIADSKVQNEQKMKLFPNGEYLIQKIHETNDSDMKSSPKNSLLTSNSEKNISSDKTDKKTSGAIPKWFKIGKK